MIVILHPEQAAEVNRLSADLGLDPSVVVRLLLSGPLFPEPDLSRSFQTPLASQPA